MSWIDHHAWVVGAIVLAALALAGLRWRSARHRPQVTRLPGAAARRQVDRRQVDLTFAAAVLVTLTVGMAAVLWLLEQADQVPPGKDRATLRADAIKTGATIALGTGGAAYLLLAYRRQRLDEVDARERRITELYTKAVEQLGHQKAPVRLGALYSLERLAQDNPEHRQTVIDVFCAYLRMPYQEDLQVRKAVPRILADHVRLPEGTSSAKAQHRRPSPRRAFWPGMSLDLTGAALVDFNFKQVSVIQAAFSSAIFQGVARFDGASFQGDADFDGATFQGAVWFNGATFQGAVWFSKATFQGAAWFSKATFQGDAGFSKATFQGTAWFTQAIFQGAARFNEADFQGVARFGGATFQGAAGFNKATFASSNKGEEVAGAQVLDLDDEDPNKHRVWPHGYAIRPDPADPTRGTLVHAKEEEASDHPADSGSGAG